MADERSQDIEREIALENNKAEIEEAAERMRFQVEYSQAVLRNLNFVNGGAIIALLTFIGNKGANFDYETMRWAFVFFVVGLFCSLCSYVGAFFSQFWFMNVTYSQAWNAQWRARGIERREDITEDYKRGNWAMGLGISLAVVSVLAFACGAFFALWGLAK